MSFEHVYMSTYTTVLRKSSLESHRTVLLGERERKSKGKFINLRERDRKRDRE